MSRSLGPILFNGPIKIDRLLADSATTQLLLLYLSRKALCRRIGCTNSVPIVKKQWKTVKRQSKQQKWPLVYQSSHINQDCTNDVPTMYQSSKTVKKSQKTVETAKWPLVYQSSQWSHVYQDCTNSVPIVKNSEKQSKDTQNSKKWGVKVKGLKDWG